MHPEQPHVNAAAKSLEKQFGPAPGTALVLGSGLGPVIDELAGPREVSVGEIGLPVSTVAGHAGRVVCGSLAGAEVVVLSGRVHLYEGYSANEVVRNVRAFAQWGVRRILFTCSVGGITEGLNPGCLVAVTDHLNFQMDHPLRGASFTDNRFPDLTNAYHSRMREFLHQAARSVNVPLYTGVLAAMNGPSYESPAEIRMLRTVGADIVGMSTVPEMIAAAQLGLPAATLALVSNRAAGLSNSPLTHEEVTEMAGQTASSVQALLRVALPLFEKDLHEAS